LFPHPETGTGIGTGTRTGTGTAINYPILPRDGRCSGAGNGYCAACAVFLAGGRPAGGRVPVLGRPCPGLASHRRLSYATGRRAGGRVTRVAPVSNATPARLVAEICR
jgi:hypothetical protein